MTPFTMSNQTHAAGKSNIMYYTGIIGNKKPTNSECALPNNNGMGMGSQHEPSKEKTTPHTSHQMKKEFVFIDKSSRGGKSTKTNNETISTNEKQQ